MSSQTSPNHRKPPLQFPVSLNKTECWMRAAGPSKNNANLGNRRDGKAAWTRLETGFNLAKNKVSQETFLSKRDQRRMVFGPPWVTNTHLKILDETTWNHFRPATVTEISKHQRPASGHCGKDPCIAAWCWGRGYWNPLCQPWLPRLRLEETYWPWHDSHQHLNPSTYPSTFSQDTKASCSSAAASAVTAWMRFRRIGFIFG